MEDLRNIHSTILWLAPVLFGTLIVGGITERTSAQCIAREEQKLLASDGEASDNFGIYVGISGDVAIVGALDDDDNGENAGAAFIYRLDPDSGQWIEEVKLLASDGQADDWFGHAVSIDGDVAVVGAYRGEKDDTTTFGGYIFRFDGEAWKEEIKLLIPNAVQNVINQTYPVAIQENVVAVGAFGDDEASSNAGAIHVFRFDPELLHWNEEAKLLARDAEAGDLLGFSIWMSGDRIIAGAVGDDDNGDIAGSSYIFQYDPEIADWVEEAKLLASDGEQQNQFGWAVAISGAIVVVGANRDDDNGAFSGSAYVFRYNEPQSMWFQEIKLLPSDGAAGHIFGGSVATGGPSAVVVGAIGDSATELCAGSAYLFRDDGEIWTEHAKLLPTDGDAIAIFGTFVAVSQDTAIVGAMFDNDNGSNSGSAYIFELSNDDPDSDGIASVCDNCPQHANPKQEDCNNDGLGDLCAIADGLSEDCNANGIPDECEVLDQFTALSKVLSPIGDGFPQGFTVAEPPDALGDVSFLVQAVADLGSSNEFIDVFLNDVFIGSVFQFTCGGSGDCMEGGINDSVDLPSSEFNAIVSGGDATIDLVSSVTMDPFACDGSSSVVVTIEYPMRSAMDKNENGIPDDCEVQGDLDGDDVVGASDLLILLANWGTCADCDDCIADIDGDCTVGASDLLILLANWG